MLKISDRILALPRAERKRYYALAVQFDDAWGASPHSPPDITAYLPAEEPLRLLLLAALVRCDMEYRSKRGEPASVEGYLDRFPELRDDAAAKLDLVCWEWQIVGGCDGKREDWSARFPDIAEDLSRLLPVSLWTAPPGYNGLEKLGRGSMGEVWKAWHVGLKRLVALKTILAGRLASSREVQRFLREAEAAGRLDHPNIVSVYDVGEHGGQYYFSMEFVEGQNLQVMAKVEPLTRDKKWQRRVAAIMATVAKAVQHAHQCGVLHRDLKPSNILLAEGDSPVVTDFGLATWLHSDSSLTAQGDVVGTPSYMAPEQACGKERGTITSDVYALGAVLYELSTGRPPFRGLAFYDTIRLVIETDPEKPRKISPQLDRDLETICLKCLEKDPVRRYASALALAEDLERWLRDEPIHARPVPVYERWWLWCKRHPWVAALTTFTILTVVAGILGVVWQWREAVWEKGQKEIALEDALNRRRQAEYARDGAAALNRFLTQRVIGSMRPAGRGGIKRNVTLREAIDAAASHIPKDFEGQPELEASVRQTLGVAYLELGAYSAAILHGEKALELRRLTLGSEHKDTLISQGDLGVAYLFQGQPPKAESLLRSSLESLRESLGPEDPLTLVRGMHLGMALRQCGKWAEAETTLQEVMRTNRRLFGDDDLTTLACQANLGGVLGELGKLREAEELLRDGLNRLRRLQGADHILTIDVQVALAGVLSARGQQAEAIELLDEALEISRGVLGREHQSALVAQHLLTSAQKDQRPPEEIDQSFRLLIDNLTRILGAEHYKTLRTQNELAVFLYGRGKFAEAAALLDQILTTSRRVRGNDHPDTVSVQSTLASTLVTLGKWSEAEEMFRKVLAVQRRSPGPDHPSTLATQNNLGTLLGDQGKQSEAEEMFGQTLVARRRILGPEHPDTLVTQNNLAGALLFKGDTAGAEALFRRTLEAQRRSPGPEHTSTLITQQNLAATLIIKGDLTEAEELLRKALKAQRRFLGPEHPNTLGTQFNLAGALSKQGKWAEAEAELRSSLPACERKLPPGYTLTANVRVLLGECLLKRSRYDEAEPLLLAGYQVLSQSKNVARSAITNIVDRLVELYEARGQKDKANTWRSKRPPAQKS